MVFRYLFKCFSRRVLTKSFKLNFSTNLVLNKKKMAFNYPNVRRDNDVKEIQHGIEISDPYRWLEDPDCDDTKQFVQNQNDVTMPFIESCQYKAKIKERLTELWNYPKYGCPFKRGSKYFYYMNMGLQNQSVLYIQDTLDSEARVFLDPNKLSEDGTTSLSVTSFSEDGQWFAYGLSDSGSDWVRIKIRNVETGNDCDETLTKIKFTSIAWTHDNEGFFYAYYPDHDGKSDGTEIVKMEQQKLYYHKLNTDQSKDILVVQFPEKPHWRVGAVVSDCGKYLHAYVRESCQDCLWYYTVLDGQPIEKELELIPIIKEFNAEYDYVTNDDHMCYIRTNRNAPNFRLVKIDLKQPSEENWNDIIPEHAKDVLDWVNCVNNDVMVVCYIRDVVNIIELRKLNDGSLIRNLDFPIGSITGFSGKRKQNEIFYYLTSFLTPGIIYHYEFKGEPKIFREIKIKNFDAAQYMTNQYFYKSKDGTKIPLFVVHHKDITLNGDNVCLLYGYGGFNISIQPSFSVQRILLMKHLNGIFAVANIRGGGEYGEKWHDTGKLLNKQNVFDDFHSAAEYLIESRYTNSKKLIIQGGSNGGLLVGACANQRPDLYGCIIAHVGVMDMLRFHKFTIGHAWVSDYGNPNEETHFKNILKFSPLHNIPNNCESYPATLLLTGDHDDRVVPLHSLKFIAELQHKRGQKDVNIPLMIRIDTKAGHGAGKPTTKVIEEMTDIYCFIIKSLGLKYYD